MSRWNDTVTLVSLPYRRQRPDGSWETGEPVETEVYCNRFTVSATERSEPVDTGLMDVAEVQVRSDDYLDEPRAVYHGREYQVVSVTCTGEFTRIRLERLISNA